MSQIDNKILTASNDGEVWISRRRRAAAKVKVATIDWIKTERIRRFDRF